MTDTHTPHRNVRVADERWNPFGFAVGGRNRSAWLNEFIACVVDNPKLWHDTRAIAERRGETVWDVITKALIAYRNRNRDELDSDE